MKVYWSNNDTLPQFRLVIRVSSNFYKRILQYIQDKLFTVFQESCGKTELLKLVYGN